MEIEMRWINTGKKVSQEFSDHVRDEQMKLMDVSPEIYSAKIRQLQKEVHEEALRLGLPEYSGYYGLGSDDVILKAAL